MNDDTLIRDFLARRIEPSCFGHLEHVKVAWLLLSRFPFDRALREFEAGARDLASRAGFPEKFHVTLTTALMKIIASDFELAADTRWESYISTRPLVMGNPRALLEKHYSPERLASEAARRSWLEPDRLALPGRQPFARVRVG